MNFNDKHIDDINAFIADATTPLPARQSLSKRVLFGALTAVAITISAHASDPVAAISRKTPRVNINTASREELMLLPGIDKRLADNICRVAGQGFGTYFDRDRLEWVRVTADPKCHRKCHFKMTEDLLKVAGVGPATVDLVFPYVVLEGPTTAREKIVPTRRR